MTFLRRRPSPAKALVIALPLPRVAPVVDAVAVVPTSSSFAHSSAAAAAAAILEAEEVVAAAAVADARW